MSVCLPYKSLGRLRLPLDPPAKPPSALLPQKASRQSCGQPLPPFHPREASPALPGSLACQPRCSPAVPWPATCTPAAASRLFVGLSLRAPLWCFPVYSFHSPPLHRSSVVHQETVRRTSVISPRCPSRPQRPAHRAGSPGTQRVVSGVIAAGQASLWAFLLSYRCWEPGGRAPARLGAAPHGAKGQEPGAAGAGSCVCRAAAPSSSSLHPGDAAVCWHRLRPTASPRAAFGEEQGRHRFP